MGDTPPSCSPSSWARCLSPRSHFSVAVTTVRPWPCLPRRKTPRTSSLSRSLVNASQLSRVSLESLPGSSCSSSALNSHISASLSSQASLIRRDSATGAVSVISSCVRHADGLCCVRTWVEETHSSAPHALCLLPHTRPPYSKTLSCPPSMRRTRETAMLPRPYRRSESWHTTVGW